jgi:hypothetical protein
MSRGPRNIIPLTHDDSQWALFGAVRVRYRRQSLAVQVQVSTGITHKERLGSMVQLLAKLYSHQGQTSEPPGDMGGSDSQKMDMVL